MNRTVRRPRRKPAARLTDGGNHALNFINTFKKDRKGGFIDLLTNYESLVNWAQQTDLINWDESLGLWNEGNCNPPEAELCYCTARSARNTLDELFNDLLAGREVHPLVIDRFNDQHNHVRQHLRYETGTDGMIREHFYNINEDMNLPLYLIIAEAARLLDTGLWRQIKKCPACGSLFMDVSRAHNRTWCSPKTCGSIKKSQRYYQLKKVA
ncbi:CGNR zinc finger domain-containing protein [Mucilaginibacter sp. UR6-11]|uniref:CGNR zinc finger domain-containing protein n=1 Tax=Mucilaginibacter sp. UR6-11 TaxID=1435644 RepID=UPI001E565475|nr:CGNR zinc finger domain-containing protein [Mucilaginibacter sp. UR6-11]MCC8424370.1 CGNR zinc finger domain-containing protein [Mucilaginibacter sp. UR6-11]